MTDRGAGPAVLVVEDDDETRAVIVRDLHSRGYRPVEAIDGRTALMRWEARRPDVVLLDLGLPDIEGIQPSGASGAMRQRRSSSCRRGTRNARRSRRLTPVPTTT